MLPPNWNFENRPLWNMAETRISVQPAASAPNSNQIRRLNPLPTRGQSLPSLESWRAVPTKPPRFVQILPKTLSVALRLAQRHRSPTPPQNSQSAAKLSVPGESGGAKSRAKTAGAESDPKFSGHAF